MLKQPIYYEFNLDARTSPSKLIAISHVDDKYSEVLEVAIKQNDRFVYMGGATVVARMVLHRDKDYLLSDDVTCTVNANGNILIPFDNAVVKTSQGGVKIEVNITRDADELTLQFPLWVSVTGSILDNAEVTPESEGTIPDLLKDAADALEDAKEALEEIGDSKIESGVVNQNGTITFFDENGDPLFTTTGESVIGPKGDNGDTGAAGADGYSPTVSTTNLDAQTLVTVTDKNGAHNFYVKDGSSVTNAAVDENGDLIISIQQKPTSSVHPTIHTLEVNAGHVVGAAGAKGDKGDKGDTGNDYVLTAQDKADIAGMVDISGKADKATTLAGYGITDAYTKTQTGTLLNAKESTANKVTAVNSSASDTQYPSAKAVYDFGANILNDVAEEVGDLKSTFDLMTEWKYKSFCPLTFHQGRLDTSNRPVTINTTNTYFVYTDYVDISAVPLNDKLYFVAPPGINVLGFMVSSSDNNPANSAVTGWKNGTVCEWAKTSNAFKYFAISAYISYSATFTPEQAASSGIGVYQIAESVDDALSANSENPVQNKIVYAAIENTKEILMTSQIPVSYTLNRNKYINFNSGKVISTSSNYAYTTPIHAEQGDVVFLPQVNDSAVIAKLSEVVIENESYRGLANIGTTEGRAFYFVIPRECDVVFCAPEGRLGEFKLFHGIAIKSILDAAYGKTSNGIFDLKKTANAMHPSGGQILYKGDTAVNSGHLVNALAYDNGVIIGARSDGKIVRIGYDGTEETLLSLNGSNMDWRCLFKDSSGNVYASPHATFGSLQMTDRGLYRLSGTTLAWVDLEHPSWETGAIRSAPVGNAIRFNPDASAFRHTFAQVTTGDTVRIRVYTTASTVNIYGAFTDDNNIVIASPTEYFPTDQVAAFRDLPSLTVPTGATRLHIMTYTQSGWESECRIQAYQTIPPASSFVKVISLYDPSSSVQTETEENNDTIWTMCEDDNGNLYAGAYAHTAHANPAIYKSTDGGLTWNYLFNFNSAGLTSNGRHIHSIVYSKWQKALYCIVGEVKTIFKSVDGGESWVNLNVVLNVKGTVMLPTPSGIIIGSDGAYNLFIDVLENDDTTHYNVFTGWANTVFALRLSDITGFVYAFTKIDSAVKNVNYYPPISALTDPSAITTWQNSVPAATFDAWSNYRNSVLSEYPDDAIRPQHYAILVSRNGGGTWEVLRRWKCPSNGAYGFITTGQFLNGECITGLYNELGFVNPIIISEGKHKYISGGCDLDGEIFVRTNASSTVTVL